MRLQERQGAASSSASPSRGEELRLLPTLETVNLAERAFLSEVALSSAAADLVEEERDVSPSVHGESGSLARAASTGFVGLSESEDETMGRSAILWTRSANSKLGRRRTRSIADKR